MNADKLHRQTAGKNETFEGSISEIKTKDIALVVLTETCPVVTAEEKIESNEKFRV